MRKLKYIKLQIWGRTRKGSGYWRKHPSGEEIRPIFILYLFCWKTHDFFFFLSFSKMKKQAYKTKLCSESIKHVLIKNIWVKMAMVYSVLLTFANAQLSIIAFYVRSSQILKQSQLFCNCMEQLSIRMESVLLQEENTLTPFTALKLTKTDTNLHTDWSWVNLWP